MGEVIYEHSLTSAQRSEPEVEVGGYVDYVDLCDENKNGFVKIILTLIEGRLLVWRYLSQFNMTWTWNWSRLYSCHRFSFIK